MIGVSTATAWEERIGMRIERTVERGGEADVARAKEARKALRSLLARSTG
jgi:hypothetical protein